MDRIIDKCRQRISIDIVRASLEAALLNLDDGNTTAAIHRLEQILECIDSKRKRNGNKVLQS